MKFQSILDKEKWGKWNEIPQKIHQYIFSEDIDPHRSNKWLLLGFLSWQPQNSSVHLLWNRTEVYKILQNHYKIKYKCKYCRHCIVFLWGNNMIFGIAVWYININFVLYDFLLCIEIVALFQDIWYWSMVYN